MLTEHKTPGTLVAEIRMNRMSHDGAFLLVEGKDDIRFWRSRHHTSCELVDGEGKLNVVGGIQKINDAGLAGVLGIVDSDYDLLNDIIFEPENLLATDAHDLECLLCRSSTLDKVLAEYGDHRKIKQFEDETEADVRTALLERALVFGRVRWAAIRCRPVINLGNFSVQRFLDKDTWTVTDEESICNKLLDSHNDNLTLTSCIKRLPEADPWYVARGHDMIEILQIGLRHRLGNTSASVREIGRVLRAAMSADDLRETELWKGMQVWEDGNSPYLVLADGLR